MLRGSKYWGESDDLHLFLRSFTINTKDNPTIITCSLLVKPKAELASAALKDADEPDPDDEEAKKLIAAHTTITLPSQPKGTS